MMFLPHQPYLLAADEQRTVAVWDYAAVSQLPQMTSQNLISAALILLLPSQLSYHLTLRVGLAGA